MAIEPGQSWEVDLFRPEDAPGVVQLFRTVYGEGYPVRTFIEPDRLLAENAAHRTISTVARTPKGDIVGHTAVFNSAAFSGAFESGAGAVHPLYRGGAGIFTSMVVHGQRMLMERFAGRAIFGESVCNHVFSQKMCHSLGWTTQAVEVDLMPAAAYAKEKSAPGRVSSLVDFKTLRPRPHQVFLPPTYEEALRFIYSGLDDERQTSLSTGRPPEGSMTSLEPRVFTFAQVARLVVQEAGQDFAPVLEREERAAAEQGVVVFQAWLKLSCPWVAWAVEVLRGRGYFLGGLLPRWFDDDGLLMQRMSRRPHWEDMALHFDRGKAIVEIARKDWERSQT